MRKKIAGPVSGLYDHWIEENDGRLLPMVENDTSSVLQTAVGFCSQVTKLAGNYNPIFNQEGCMYLGAFMASKLIRRSGLVSDLTNDMSNAIEIFIDEATYHTGRIAEELKRAGESRRSFLFSALESTGLTSNLREPVIVIDGLVLETV